jgi:thiamine-phosphate pyrophosphorylase
MASTLEKAGLIRPSATWRLRGRLYFLTMDEAAIGHVQQVEAACQAGIRWIQLRMKQAGADEVREAALAAKKICDERDCVLIINDRVEIAAEVKAHGVHLGKQDMPVSEARQRLGEDAIIGGTANTIEDIREHYRQGADYIGLGPYRYTTTKKDLSPILGLEGYRSIMSRLRQEGIPIPIVAIGGIGMKDAVPLLEAGLQGIAFSGLLVHAGDRHAMVQSLEEEVSKSLLC